MGRFDILCGVTKGHEIRLDSSLIFLVYQQITITTTTFSTMQPIVVGLGYGQGWRLSLEGDNREWR